MKRGPRIAAAGLAIGCSLAWASVAGAEPAPLRQFAVGIPGGGATQFNGPFGVAVDATGNLHVADTFNHRISVFSPQGAFVRAFGFDVSSGGGTGFEACTGGCKTGVAGGRAGQLSQPAGVAFDLAGNLHVADSANHRISVFSPQGAFVRAFGFDVHPAGGAGFESCAASCKAGVAGGAAGQLNVPVGLAVDPVGNLVVADSSNHRISVFNPTGGFVGAAGFDVMPGGGAGFEACAESCKAGVAGGAAGQLSTPAGVALDAAGNLHVAEAANNRISVFDDQGAFVGAFGFDVGPGAGTGLETCTTSCKAGVAGGGAGQLDFPRGLAFDLGGNLHVADTFNHRISVFSPQGAFARAFGFDVTPGGAADFEVCAESCKAATAGKGTGQLSAPAGLAADCRGAIYAADQNNHRIQRFGEPGTALPPCGGQPGPQPPPPSEPVHDRQARAQPEDRHREAQGWLPGAGRLELSGSEVERRAKQVDGAGEVTLAVEARGEAKRKLAHAGAVKVRLAVTFTPIGGDPSTRAKKAVLSVRRRP